MHRSRSTLQLYFLHLKMLHAAVVGNCNITDWKFSNSNHRVQKKLTLDFAANQNSCNKIWHLNEIGPLQMLEKRLNYSTFFSCINCYLKQPVRLMLLVDNKFALSHCHVIIKCWYMWSHSSCSATVVRCIPFPNSRRHRFAGTNHKCDSSLGFWCYFWRAQLLWVVEVRVFIVKFTERMAAQWIRNAVSSTCQWRNLWNNQCPARSYAPSQTARLEFFIDRLYIYPLRSNIWDYLLSLYRLQFSFPFFTCYSIFLNITFPYRFKYKNFYVCFY